MTVQFQPDVHYGSMDKMIDNELNREYSVKCNRCARELTTWIKCIHCGLIYFCECYPEELMCKCTDSRIDMRRIIESMKQLIYGAI